MIAEIAARHERPVVIASLAAVTAGALFVTIGTGDLLMMAPAAESSSTLYLALMFVMWWTMMMAMMLPSAAPAILLFGALSRKRAAAGAAIPAAAFAGGYAIVWAGFSLAAVMLQLALARMVFFDGMMEAHSVTLGGILLMAAGIYQLTPWKSSCLKHCQSPLLFFAHNWRSGMAGALRMGVAHGLYCVGCCAVLMGLLFYGGVMDLWWIAGLAAYVLIEKLVVRGPLLSRLSGGLLLVWGAAVLWRTA